MDDRILILFFDAKCVDSHIQNVRKTLFYWESTDERTPMAERRKTIQLDAIRTAVLEAGRPLSIAEILEESTKSVPTISLRTVYRVIRKLEEEEVITAVTLPSQPDRYESSKAAEKHHHHFHCTKCDRLFDVDGCPGRLKQLIPDGFVLTEHDLTLRGLCASCA